MKAGEGSEVQSEAPEQKRRTKKTHGASKDAPEKSNNGESRRAKQNKKSWSIERCSRRAKRRSPLLATPAETNASTQQRQVKASEEAQKG